MTAPASNPTTSAEAAVDIAAQLPRLERTVFEAIREGQRNAMAGLTSEEVCARTGLRTQTVTARIRALVLRGVVHDSGGFRFTAARRRAIVWSPVPGANLFSSVPRTPPRRVRMMDEAERRAWRKAVSDARSALERTRDDAETLGHLMLHSENRGRVFTIRDRAIAALLELGKAPR